MVASSLLLLLNLNNIEVVLEVVAELCATSKYEVVGYLIYK